MVFLVASNLGQTFASGFLAPAVVGRDHYRLVRAVFRLPEAQCADVIG
jgi:hypothetical protein